MEDEIRWSFKMVLGELCGTFAALEAVKNKDLVDSVIYLGRLKSFFQKYEIEFEIKAAGSFGLILFGQCTENNEKVCVKVIQEREIFEFVKKKDGRILPTEIYALYEVKNIKGCLEILEYFQMPQTYIIVTKRYENYFDLMTYFQKNGEFTSEFAVKRICAQLIEILMGLLDMNFVYCDLKSENILYSPENHDIKLIDFGCIKKVGSREEMISQIKYNYTSKFMCPEYKKNKKCLPEPMLVYSVGVLAFYLLTGAPPKYISKRYRLLAEKMGRVQFKFGHSEKFFDFLAKTTDRCPRNRLTLVELLKNEWLIDNE